MKTRAGFTLIELLVVMAIIMVLSGFLYPTFAPAKAKGRQVACMNNIKQLAYALDLYCSDHDDHYPTENWVPHMTLPNPDFDLKKGELFPYVRAKGVFYCPSDSKAYVNGVSYEMNELLVGMINSAASDPVSTVLLLDAGVDDGIFRVGSASVDTPIPVFNKDHKASDVPNPMNAVHLDKATVLFMDGHANVIPYGQLTVGMFDPTYAE